MNTAIKARSSESNEIEIEIQSGFRDRSLSSDLIKKKEHSSEVGRNARRIQMILMQEHETPDVFELFGWMDLPNSLKKVIQIDMEAYRDEILGLYSTCDIGVKNRRKRISYWIKAYKEGICSEETAVNMLSI